MDDQEGKNCCETCKNLVYVATTIGQLQHSENLKPTFLDTFKWAIQPVFPETVTFVSNLKIFGLLSLLELVLHCHGICTTSYLFPDSMCNTPQKPFSLNTVCQRL